MSARLQARSLARAGTAGALLASLALAGGAVAGAEAPCEVPPEAALGSVARSLARGLGPGEPPGAVEVTTAPGTDPPGDGAALAARLASALRGALGTPAVPRGAPPSRTGVLRVRAVVDGGRLRADAEVVPPPTGRWARARGERPAAPRRASASRPVDAEVAGFLPAVELGALRPERVRLGGLDAVALGCGDLDADGRVELVVVTRTRLAAGRVGAGGFVVEREVSWSALSGVAPSPLRDPIAAVSLGAGGLCVGSSDRERAVALGPDLSPGGPLAGVVPVPGLGCLPREGRDLGTPLACSPGAPTPAEARALARVDSVAGAWLIDRAGVATAHAAYRSPQDPTLHVVGPSGPLPPGPRVGAALAVGDVDRDGVPEILASVDTEDAARDALLVLSARAGAAPVERLRVPVSQAIRAVAVCPAEGPGPSPVALVTPHELWVLR